MEATTAKKASAVTGHATNPLSDGPADALFVGVAGTVVARHPGNSIDTTWTVPAGGYVLCRTTHVRATSTATGILALYY